MTCIAPNCTEVEYARGLCSRHYRTAGRHVKKGETTWAELERNGKVSKVVTRRRSTNAFSKWLLDFKKSK